MPLTVLFVSLGSGLAGAERVMLEIVEGMDRSQFSPLVAVPEEGPMTSELRRLEIPFVVVPSRWWLPFTDEGPPGYLFRNYWERLPRFVAPLLDVIEDHRVDIVYSCAAPVLHGGVAALLSRKAHLQHIQELLGRPGFGLAMPFGRARLAYRLLGALSSLMVCVGRTGRSDVGGAVADAKCRVVRLGFSAGTAREPMPLPGTAGSVRVGLAGGVWTRKGADLLPAIVQRTCAVQPDVEFYWLGPGLPEVTGPLASRSVVDDVPKLHFLGYHDDARPFMQAIDLLLHPSRADTFPRVLFEAGAAGKPVVATRCGGPEEMIRDGETGLLVDVDDVDAMAAAIVSLARDPERRARMGASARDLVAGFGMEGFVQGMQQALRDAHERGPVLKSAAAVAAAKLLVEAPGRILPGARRTVRGLMRSFDRGRRLAGRLSAGVRRVAP